MNIRIRYMACCVGLLVAFGVASVSGQDAPEQPAGVRKMLPVPSPAAQKEKRAYVMDIYKKEAQEARSSPARCRAFAKKLLQVGISTTKDSAARYALFELASEAALQGGDVDAAFEAIDQMGKDFDVDALSVKAETIEKAFKARLTVEQRRSLLSKMMPLIDELAAADHFDDALKLNRVAIGAARTARDTSLMKQVLERSREIVETQKTYASVEKALAQLKQTPGDPAANLEVGRYRCFYKGDWDGGLKHLALGGDPNLKKAARMELARPTEAKHRVMIADAWWELSKTEGGTLQKQMKRRAAEWYEQAIDGLVGLAKLKAEKRLKELEKEIVEPMTLPPGAVVAMNFEKGTFATKGERVFIRDLSGNGNHGEVHNAKLAAGVKGSAMVFDGESTYVDLGNPPALQIVGDQTIAFWINPAKFGARRNPYAKAYGGEGTMTLETGGQINYWYGQGRGDEQPYRGYGTSKSLTAQQWVHLALVRDLTNGIVVWYFNGTPINTLKAKHNPASASTQNAYIGKGYVEHFVGMIDEFAIWNRALTPQEIAELVQAGGAR